MDSDTDRPSESEARKEQLGAEAFERIKKHWADWRHIATCFAVGNTKAMREAGTNRPYGRAYTHAFGKWLDAEPWRRTYDKVTRSHLLWVADHSNEIDDWRNTLAQNVRDKLNHPSTLKRHYEAAHRIAAADPNASPKKANDKEALVARNVELEEENKRLKADGGSLFTGKTPHKMTARIMGEEYGLDWLMSHQKAVATEIATLKKRLAEKHAG